MLTAILLHRRRKAAEAAAKAIKETGGAIEQTRAVYGTRLLIRGLLWASVYMLSRGLLELLAEPPAARIAIAFLPTPFFVYYLWTWMKGVGEMDELQRRIELEALGFAFPASLVFLATLGLEDGTTRTIRRAGNTPRIEVQDPLAKHRELLGVLTNTNMHDVTAFLSTLK